MSRPVRVFTAFLFLFVALVCAGIPKAAAAAGSQAYVDAGGAAVGNWAGDPSATSSNSGTIATAVDSSGVENPAPAAVYASYRIGTSFRYTVSGLTPNGWYNVRLHFAEPTATGPNQRVFNVLVDGTLTFANVDVFAISGARARAAALYTGVRANANGAIIFTFAGVGGSAAIVNGIEIVAPVLIRTGAGATGNWLADPGPSSGSAGSYVTGVAIDTSGVARPAPQAVYQSSRYGADFTYTASGLTASAAYSVRLHFSDPAATRVGQRLFNITINGAPAAWNFDIFATAGAVNRAVTRSFGTTANAMGQITIRFVGQNGGDATVSGIEIREPGAIPASAADNTTSHYDALRTSWNPQEQALTTSNVRWGSFGLKRSLPVDGSVDAQPLVATGVMIPTLGARHDLLVVATAKDSVYAFDANTGALIWQRSLVGPSERSLVNADVAGCADTQPDIGIMGTPVIDRASNMLYVDAPTYSSATNQYYHRLHALNLTSGVDAVTPVIVSGTVPATGQLFNAQFQRQRAGLTLANGNVYVAFASYCDVDANAGNDPVVGWLMGFNTATLAPIASGDPFSNVYLDSIWQGGVAPAVDASGNIYFATGNGPYDGGANLDNSIIKVGPNLARLDSFTTRNQTNETNYDLDLASAGVMLLPDQPGTYQHLVAHEGKVPALRILNRDRLGGYSGGLGNPESILTYAYETSCDPTLSTSCADPNPNQAQAGGVWGGIAYYTGPNAQQFIVVANQSSYAHSYAIGTGGSVTLARAANSVWPLSNEGGATPVVTSNGTLPGSAIVWLVSRDDPTYILEAYDASSMNLIYAVYGGQWDSAAADSMLVPTVADGQVFVGSQVIDANGVHVSGAVNVFGLLQPVTPYSDARPALAARFSAIRLAGTTVYGPGSRVLARAEPPHVTPIPGVHAPHRFFGILRRFTEGTMLFEVRGGRFVSVDVRAALRRGTYGRNVRVGKVCLVEVNRAVGETGLEALSVTAMRRPLRVLPRDR